MTQSGIIQRRHNLQGMAYMLVAVGSLSMMDACLKTLARDLPAMQVTALRAMVSLPIVLVWISLSGGFAQLRSSRFGLHAIRGLIGIMSLGMFAWGVRSIPLSEAYAIFFVAPLLITVFAAVILRERVGWSRWLAIGVGFGGVLFVLRPSGSSAATLPGLAILGTAVSYALSAITVRVLGRTDSTQSMVFWLMTFVAAGAGVLALPVWRPLDGGHAPVLVALAVTGSVGQWTLTEAFRRAESSVIAPLEYTALAWGAGLDWLFWATAPGGRTLIGAAIVIASGVYLMRREKATASAVEPSATVPTGGPTDDSR